MLRFNSAEPGVIVSGGVHIALLLATLVAFAETRSLPDAQESVPVDIITDQQFNEITKGEKEAKKPAPTPTRADRKAEVEEKKPPVQREAKLDIPTPPPPLKRQIDPEDDDTPEPVPTPPRRAIAAVQPEPPKPEPPRPPLPTPPVRPTPPKLEAKPKPEEKPLDKTALAKLLAQEKAEEKAEEKPKEKPMLDKAALSKLLDQKKAEDKPVARPKSGEETNEPKTKFDPGKIASALSKDAPGQKPSTSRAPATTASIGAPAASAPKMSPSMAAQLDGILLDQYRACFTYLNLGNTNRYVPRIKVEYSRDGMLSGQPALVNPSNDPNVRALADAALRAIRRCNPLKIPAQFAPYFDQWKSRFVRFDPEELSG